MVFASTSYLSNFKLSDSQTLRSTLFSSPTSTSLMPIEADATGSTMVVQDVAQAMGLCEPDSGQYQKMQRKRAKRASEFLKRPTTLSNLVISAFMITPIEKILFRPHLFSELD